MDEERIEKLIEKTQLRARMRDVPVARALAASAEQAAEAIPHVPVNEHTAPMLFDAVYKAIRHIGDGFWWLQGYEARTHDASIEMLAEKSPAIRQDLERLKQLRHDAAYRGVKISPENANEILRFWKEYGTHLLTLLKKEAV